MFIQLALIGMSLLVVDAICKEESDQEKTYQN